MEWDTIYQNTYDVSTTKPVLLGNPVIYIILNLCHISDVLLENMEQACKLLGSVQTEKKLCGSKQEWGSF